ncbi:MAG: S1 family peptidase [Acidobacteriota bacterium]
MDFSKILWTCLAIFLLLLPAPTDAQGLHSQAVSEALERDAVAYAEYFGTDIEEALQRLDLQARIGELDAALTEETADTFAGLWLDHDPEFEVVALYTNASAAQEWLNEEALGDLAPLITVQPAAVTLKQLEAFLEEAETQLRAADQVADLWINVRENQVEILTPAPEELTAALATKRISLPPHSAIVEVEALAQPEADIRGGRKMSRCTAGFAVRSPTGRLGITTAGHCSNSSRHIDRTTPTLLISETYSGSHDVQWHLVGCDDMVVNQIFDGTSNRTISAEVGRSSQAIGTFVCKYGKTTGATCGFIVSKSLCPNYVPNGKSTFIVVNGSIDLSSDGDSGGPWYVGNSAYGIHSGGYPNDNRAIYMAVDYMTSQGYSVLRYPAGVTPYATISCYNDSSTFSCTASGRNGNPPYTFSNWQYYGPAASWSGGSLAVSGFFGEYPGCNDGDYNYVSVQVTDSCGRTGSGGKTFYCPDGNDCGGPFMCDGPEF